VKGEVAMTINVQLADYEERFLQRYMERNQKTAEEVIKEALFVLAEEEHDLRLAREWAAQYDGNEPTYSHDEVVQLLGIDDGV